MTAPGGAVHLRKSGSIVLLSLLVASCGGGNTSSTDRTAPPADLRYPSPPIFALGRPITPLTPTVTGTVTTYAVSPPLPAGLSINAGTGTISGTPTALAALSNYTVTAGNAAGSASTMVAIAVDAAAPSISYGAGKFTLTVGVPVQTLIPANSGGAAVAWSISPALPAGLTFSTATGVIGGTPTAVAAPAPYVVRAQNSGGRGTAHLMLGVQSVLLDLGHVQEITLLRVTASRVLSLDRSDSWVLWNYASALKLNGGLAVCRSSACVAGSLAPVDLEAGTLVDETAAGLEVRSASDGTLLAVLPAPIAWWKLATDGSYVCTGSATALTVWSPAGAVIASRAGDYSNAAAFAAPGQVQVALGPAGASVVETVTLPSGTSAVGKAFQGTFNSWFLDGQHFLTTTGDTVWTYTNASVQADITQLPTVANLAGQGRWFWTYSSASPTPQVNIYQVGASGSPSATYSPGVDASIIASGLTLGILAYGTGAGTVVDLSGASLAAQNFAAPVAYTAAFGGTSPSQWLVGNMWGVLLDGTSIAGMPRYFGHGAAWSIAGSGSRVAVATASGAILYFNAATDAQEGTIGFSSSQLVLSSDGSVLAAAGDQVDAQYHDDHSVNVYALPSGAQIHSWPYSYAMFEQGGTLPFEISLSGSGTALGQVLGTSNGTWTCMRQVTGVSGGAVLWSDSSTSNSICGAPIRLTPDGTRVAASAMAANMTALQTPLTTTSLYTNGALVTTVNGSAVGWLDDSRVLVNTYTYLDFPGSCPCVFAEARIYDASGTLLASPALPELQSLQIVSAESVYDAGSNAIYSTTTGMAVWSTASPSTGVGAVAGADIVFASGSQVVVQPF